MLKCIITYIYIGDVVKEYKDSGRNHRKRLLRGGNSVIHCLVILWMIFGISIITNVFSATYVYGQSCEGVAAGYVHTCVLASGGNVDCYGYNYYGQAADYSGGDAVGVTAGDYHTCVLTSRGNVDCYGSSTYGPAPTGRLPTTAAAMPWG
jgi:alpha-tubulin suppressor-like RCC1 family protein